MGCTVYPKNRRSGSHLLRRYGEVLVTHRALVLIAVLIATVALGRGLLLVRVEVDPDQQLPQSHPYIQTLNLIHRLFGDKNLVIVGLQPNDGDIFSAAFLGKVERINERLLEIPGASPTLLQSIASSNAKAISLSELGFTVEPLIVRSPEAIDSAATKERILSDPSLVGTLVASDLSAVAVYVTFELSAELPGYVNLHQAVLEALRLENDGSFRSYLSGPVVIASLLTTHASDIGYFFLLSLMIIGVVHYDAFRSWQAVIFPLATGMLAVSWALGLMGLLGVAIDPYNSTTPVLILAVAAGHAVQILKRYCEELDATDDSREAVVESIVRVGPVMIAAGSIAALSFLSLATLGTDSMRTFGFFTGVGILAALINEMTTIPALRATIPAPRRTARTDEKAIHPRLSRVLDRLGRFLSSPRSAQRVLVGYLALVALTLILALRIGVDTSLKRNFGTTDQARIDDDFLNSHFAGTNVLLLLVEGPDEGALTDPEALRAINRFELRVERLPGVGKVLSVIDTLKRINSVITDEATYEVPKSKELATQYLFLYTLSGGDDLFTKLSPDNRIAKITVLLKDDSTKYGEETIARVYQIATEELPPSFHLEIAGTLASNAALTQTMVHGKILNVAQVAAITTIVASVILRSILGGLLVAAPLAIAVLINFGVMGALGIPLDISTAVISALAVGIGADYAVYFLFRVREEYGLDRDLQQAMLRSMNTSGKAIFYVSSAVGLGYAVLCISGFRIFVQLGAFVALSMATSSLTTLLVVPSLLTLMARSNLIHGILPSGNASDVAELQMKEPAVRFNLK